MFIFFGQQMSAQQIIFSDNFENKKIDSCWQIVTGNWRIDGVDQLRIAPAENGYRHVLCSGGRGYIGDQIVGLIVNLPDTGSFKKIKISLSCYIMANAPGTKIEGAFYEKEIKDGLRGKRWVANLLRMKGRWTAFSKTLTIPAKANSLRLTFFGLESSGIKDRIVCFDTIAITAFK